MSRLVVGPTVSRWFSPTDLDVTRTCGASWRQRPGPVPDGGSFFGESGIAEVLGACAGLTAQAVADEMVAAALACQDGQARDDIAVVVVKVPPSGER